jgi:hypothetical protein
MALRRAEGLLPGGRLTTFSIASGTLSGMLSSMSSESEKVRENRLRRMADRQGFRLEKSRRRDHRALDFGRYYLVTTGGTSFRTVIGRLADGRHGMTLDDVEAFLTREPGSDRQAGQAGLPMSSAEEGTSR